MIEIFRQYLEIKSLNELNDVKKPDEKCKIEILDNPDFQLNKFFYKQIGKIIGGLIDYHGLIKIGKTI